MLSFRAEGRRPGVEESAPSRRIKADAPNKRRTRILNGDVTETVGSHCSPGWNAQTSSEILSIDDLKILDVPGQRSELSHGADPAVFGRSGFIRVPSCEKVRIPRLAALARNDGVELRSLGMTEEGCARSE